MDLSVFGEIGCDSFLDFLIFSIMIFFNLF